MKRPLRSLSLQEIFFFIFLFITSVIFFQILQPFLIDLFLTFVLYVVFYRFYDFFTKRKLLSNSWAAMLTVVFISCSLLIPLSFVGVMVTREIAQNYLIIESEWPKLVHNFDQAQVDRLLQNNPKLKIFAEHIDFSKLTQGINELAGTLTRFLLEMAQNTFLNITNIALHSLLIVFFMYFFLKDGQVLKKRLQAIIPLNYKDEKAIAIKLKKVTEGIVFNTFLSGFIEGSWGAILFLITGLPSPFFWGVMMVALSIIPLVGANTVLLPAGIILLLTGSVVKGLIILIFGSGLIIVNQNFIKPKFDGKLSGMHPAIVVISSLGGMYWMGLIGFLAGPFLTAAFLVLWDQFGKKYEAQLRRNKSENSNELLDELSE